MWVQIATWTAGLGVIVLQIRHWTNILSKYIEPMIVEVEKAAEDGIITRGERKRIAMAGINALEKDGLFKLNILERICLSLTVNWLAGMIPSQHVNIKSRLDKVIKEEK